MDICEFLDEWCIDHAVEAIMGLPPEATIVLIADHDGVWLASAVA